MKREKFSASSNMLNNLTLQPSETNNDEAKALAVQKKFASRAQSTNPATTKRMIWTTAEDRQGTFSQRSISITPSQTINISKEHLRAKLGYEWK